MSSSSTKPPSGTRDFLPDDVRRREYVIGVVRRVYERYGFEQLETPALRTPRRCSAHGEEGTKLISRSCAAARSRVARRTWRCVTTGRCRRPVIAQYQNELPKFFKRYQIQPVWRADRPARGRFREFYQCDVD
jgi:histidyl-tRNA synthetase